MSRLERLLSRRSMRGAKVEVLTDDFAVILHPAGTVIRLNDPALPDRYACPCAVPAAWKHGHGKCSDHCCLKHSYSGILFQEGG